MAGSSYWMKLAPDSPVVALSPIAPRRSVLEATNAPSTDIHPIAFTPEGGLMQALALADDSSTSKKAWSDFGGVFGRSR